MGGLKEKADFEEIFDAIGNSLGEERLKNFHSHFSKIEYTKGGEKKHLTYEDDVYGPDFDFVAEIMKERDIGATIICESCGTQAEDALIMKKIYEAVKK